MGLQCRCGKPFAKIGAVAWICPASLPCLHLLVGAKQPPHRFFHQQRSAQYTLQASITLTGQRQILIDTHGLHQTLAGNRIEQAGRHCRGGTPMFVIQHHHPLAPLEQLPGQQAARQALADDEGVEIVVVGH